MQQRVLTKITVSARSGRGKLRNCFFWDGGGSGCNLQIAVAGDPIGHNGHCPYSEPAYNDQEPMMCPMDYVDEILFVTGSVKKPTKRK